MKTGIIAGGAILLAALLIAGVLLTRGGLDGERRYDVEFLSEPSLVADGNRAHFGEAGFTDVFTFNLTPDVEAIFVNASVVYLAPGPADQATLHALLRAPNGTELEADGVLEGAAPQHSLRASFSVPLATLPAARSEEAPSPAEAEAMATNATRDATMAGEWTLELSFSSGLVPANSASAAWEAHAVGWHARAR